MVTIEFSLGDGPELQEGIKELSKRGLFNLGAGGLNVRLAYLLKDGFTIDKVGNDVQLAYRTPSDFYFGLSYLISHADDYQINYDGVNSFKGVYALTDCSRNAVRNVQSINNYVTTLALSGYKGLYLYIEDTYPVEGEKYFGYQRGGYTKEELNEIIEYAKKFSFEIIPSIQTLAHLATSLRWDTYYEVADTQDILMVGMDRTYKIIDNMLSSLSQIFKTKKINLGMDEAHFIGLGGYLNKNGYKDRKELMFEHIDKVLDLCEKYGFDDVRIWSDMLIKKYDKNEQNCVEPYNRITGNRKNLKLTPVFWDYYETDYEFYDRVIKAHKQLTKDVVFTCGGGYTWFGYTPLNRFCKKINEQAIKCAKDNGVKELVVAQWYDGGAEGSLYSGLATIVDCGCYNYFDKGDEIREKISSVATGYGYDELMSFDYPNLTYNIEKDNEITSSSKYLLYGDILNGTFEKNINQNFPSYYQRAIEKLSSLAGDGRKLSYSFDVMLKLSVLLKTKVEIQLVLRSAYKNDNKDKLKEIVVALQKLSLEAKDFYTAVVKQWEIENKSAGLDVIDIKLSGVIARINRAKTKLENYLDGTIKNIEELEKEVLPYMTIANYDFVPCNKEKCNMVAFCYEELTTAGIF